MQAYMNLLKPSLLVYPTDSGRKVERSSSLICETHRGKSPRVVIVFCSRHCSSISLRLIRRRSTLGGWFRLRFRLGLATIDPYGFRGFGVSLGLFFEPTGRPGIVIRQDHNTMKDRRRNSSMHLRDSRGISQVTRRCHQKDVSGYWG